MTDRLVGQLDDGQYDALKGFQHSFGRGSGRLAFGVARIQAGEGFPGGVQLFSDDILGQGQHPQGQRQQAHHAFGMVFSLHIQRSNAQRPSFEAGKIALDVGCAPIGPDRLGQRQRQWGALVTYNRQPNRRRACWMASAWGWTSTV